jgi:1,4-dihydroxy-2-naphthoate octaprenyltransferase
LNKKTFFTWKGLLLWSNHFYGIAAGLLCIETTFTLLKKPPSLFLIAFVYLSTVIYYTYAYFDESQAGKYNERSQWYLQNKKYLKIRQLVLILITLYIAIFQIHLIEVFSNLTIGIKIILLFAVLLSFLYYYGHLVFKKISIRNKGFLKSITITSVWVVVTCIFPIIVIVNGNKSFNPLDYATILYFLQQFLFILILAILFDIKDLNRDHDENIKTVVAKHGIKSTIRKFIVPLVLMYLTTSLFFRITPSIVFLLLPFIISFLIAFVASLVQKRTTIHENILLIDGLIIIKAVFGIVLYYAVIG